MALNKKLLKQYFQDNPGNSFKTKHVAKDLDITDENEYQLLRKMLKELASEGVLDKGRKNHFALSRGRQILIGRVQLVKKRGGFVIPDVAIGKDIYIPSYNLLGALDGDRVEAEITGHPQGANPEGKVLRVLERKRSRFIGIMNKGRKFSRVIPVGNNYFEEILVPNTETSSKHHGKKVLVEVFDWGDGTKKPLGRVIRDLDSDNTTIDEEIVLKYELPGRFPPTVFRKANEVAVEPVGDTLDGRRNFTDLVVVTIDPEGARDHDDALSVEPLAEGGYRVGIHIADVSHYVERNGVIDREAAERGMSVYLEETYIPMLPAELSSDICSLVQDKDRLTLSVVVDMDEHGNVAGWEVCRGVIRSRYKLTFYEQAQAILEDDPETSQRFMDAVKPLQTLRDLCRKRKKIRKDTGNIDFDIPELELVRDDEGRIIDTKRRERLESHRLVEEFMITANELIADMLESKGISAVYRVHAEPEPKSILGLNDQLATISPELKISSGNGKVKSFQVARLLDKAQSMKLGELIGTMVLFSMKKALYSTENLGHFGLGSFAYTHFTSPIRRYPDLLVHRLVKTIIDPPGKKSRRPYELGDLMDICRYISTREQLIESAERESVDRTIADYMSSKTGEKDRAVIIEIRPQGLRVRLVENHVEGFIHVTRMSDDFYDINETLTELKGARRGKSYKLGDSINVILEKADRETGRIDFIPADIKPAVKNDRKVKQSRSTRARKR